MKKYIYIIGYASATLVFPFCSGKKEIRDVYNDKLYVKLEVDMQDSLSGVEVYVSIQDTARKMLKYFWENGKLQSKVFFYRNKKDGPWIGYFDNGKLFFEGQYINGEKTGIFKIYHENGKISVQESYNRGKAVGHWFHYDTTGNLTKKDIYR